jgi:heme oxygenase
MRAITSESVTRDDYRRYLSRMSRVYAALEPPLLAALAGVSHTDPEALPRVRPKLPALLADCQAEGLDPPGAELGSARPTGLSESLGGLYVLEGATLGGRVIARQLRRRLPGGLDPANFLDFHGDLASAAWKAFTGGLDRLAASGEIEPERCLHGARMVFAEVHRILGATDEGGI